MVRYPRPARTTISSCRPLIGDVGQSALEEINHVTRASGSGANFGWNRKEASACYDPGSGCDRSGLTLPVAEYDHGQGDCAITGSVVHRGRDIPALTGWYLSSDACSGTIRAFSSGPGAALSVVLPTGTRIATSGKDEDGELYVADVSGGSIFQMIAGQ